MKRIEIGWRKYAVRYQSNVRDPEMYEPVHGYAVPDTQQIVVDSDDEPEQQQITLLHEALHALDREYTLLMEELDVVRLARALYTLLKKNPHLLERIWGGNDK